MSTFILVQPLAPPPATVPAPAPISWTARKSAARNLFGSSPKGSVDEELAAQNKITSEYLEARYNLDLKKLDEKWNQPISATATAKTHTHFIIDSDNVRFLNVQVEQKSATGLSYARLEGIKGTFRVRKPHNGSTKKLKRKQSQNTIKTNNNKTNNNNNNHTE